MIRISLSSLALATALAIGAATPAASETLKNTDQPTSCDCSNCSAEHCQSRGRNTEANHYQIELKPAFVDPNTPTVVYVGGSRR